MISNRPGVQSLLYRRGPRFGGGPCCLFDGLESQEGHKALEQVTLLLQIRKGFLHVKYKGILEAVIIHHLFPIVRSGNV